MTLTNLQEWISYPERLNRETLYELRSLLVRYPYFQSVRLLYLKNLYLLHDISFGAELRQAALYVADRSVLFRLLEEEKYIVSPKKKENEECFSAPDEPTLDRTLALIDAFLSTIPEEPIPSFTYDLSTDYTSYLLCEDDLLPEEETIQEQEKPKLKGQELIDGFIERAESDFSLRLMPLADETITVTDEPLSRIVSSEPVTEEEDESCFTETLAKIYVKQHRYSKALEIIKKLSLKYPKKNAYFADQIRFLEKLIINTKSK